MTKQEKSLVIDHLTQELTDSNIVYITDISGLNAAQTSDLRRACFKGDIQLKIVKNTLLRKAMENVEGKDYSELLDVLKGNTAVMYSETANAPAKLIQTIRKKSDKPVIKGAWINEGVYVGDLVDELVAIKSKEELIGDVIGLLQSPIKNLVSQLQSGGSTVAGLVKTLSER